MFDIGGWEFLVIVVLAIVVIGPKDLPAAIRSVTQWIRKAKGLARDFQSGLDEIAHEAELDKLQSEVRASIDGSEVRDAAHSIRKDIEDTVDPDDEIRKAFADDERYGDAEQTARARHAASYDEDEEEIRRRAEAERDSRLAAGKESGDGTEKADDEKPAGGGPPAARAGAGS